MTLSKAAREKENRFRANWSRLYLHVAELTAQLSCAESRLLQVLMAAAMKSKGTFTIRLKTSELMKAANLDERSYPVAKKMLGIETGLGLLKVEPGGRGFFVYRLLDPDTREPFPDEIITCKNAGTEIQF
jgi:hypothetical protein